MDIIAVFTHKALITYCATLQLIVPLFLSYVIRYNYGMIFITAVILAITLGVSIINSHTYLPNEILLTHFKFNQKTFKLFSSLNIVVGFVLFLMLHKVCSVPIGIITIGSTYYWLHMLSFQYY
jgi:hypothetical protein